MRMVVVGCAMLTDPPKPGYTVGYKCKVCGKPLMVSPHGLGALQNGGLPLCNVDALQAVRILGPEKSDVELSPIAAAQLLQAMTTEKYNPK